MNVKEIASTCSLCSLLALCQPESEALPIREKKYRTGESLLFAGNPLHHILIIREGIAKAYQVLPEGKEQIISFYFPGEPIGFNAIHEKRHPHTIKAMSDVLACSMAYEDLLALIAKTPSLQEYLLTIVDYATHQEFNYHYSPVIPAKQRLLNFLKNLSERAAMNGAIIHLPMNRQDIANFLGITSETMSRLLSELKKENKIKLLHKNKIQFVA
jgi:CRP/FNR family transcriptional regulator